MKNWERERERERDDEKNIIIIILRNNEKNIQNKMYNCKHPIIQTILRNRIILYHYILYL